MVVFAPTESRDEADLSAHHAGFCRWHGNRTVGDGLCLGSSIEVRLGLMALASDCAGCHCVRLGVRFPMIRLVVIFTFAFVLFASSAALSVDIDGRSQQMTPQQREWVRGLKNQRGILCCDGADGITVPFRIAGDHYEVLFEGLWHLVPDHAVVTAKNQIGIARTWFTFDATGKRAVRCFLPESLV